MSTLEVRPPYMEEGNPYSHLSAGEAVSLMRDIVPAGLNTLDADSQRALSLLTERVIQDDGDRLTSEYDRYNGVRDRKLEINEAGIYDQLSGKTVLVTGGTGLIGSNLMKQIVSYDPTRLVSVSRGETEPHALVDGAEYVFDTDIRDSAKLSSVVRDVQPDIIYHVAADKYNHEAETRALHTLTTNINGVQNIIEAAETARVNQIIYASTGKASRPFSPDIYASSKKTGEWLMSKAARRGNVLCSAVRFTHVVDDSNVKKKINQSIDEDSPVMLQSPDVFMYIQSAQESAQLLLNSGLEAEKGKFKVQAIRDLGAPINLADLGFGAIAKRRANVPVYFRGVVPGYEDRAWPLLFGPEAGDHSPLINSLETFRSTPSENCEKVDSFILHFKNHPNLKQQLASLQAACSQQLDSESIRHLNQQLSWTMLEARLSEIPPNVLAPISNRIQKGIRHYDFSFEDLITNAAILSAHRLKVSKTITRSVFNGLILGARQ